MDILRAKTIDLRQTRDLTLLRKENSKQNEADAIDQKIYLTSMPRRLVFELTNACNLNCVMCGRNATDFNLTRFDVDWLKIFDDVVSKIEEVTLMGWGEPTIHPKFKEILYWAKLHGLRKYFCTNGMTMNKLIDEIFDTEVDIIAVSIDGANSETNDRIRRGSNFEKIIENVTSITKRRNNWPYMNFVFTAMKSNIKQLPDVVKLAADIGLNEVKVVYLTVFDENMAEESLFGFEKQVRAIFDETILIAEKYKIGLKLPHVVGEDPSGNANHKTCYTAWRDFFLGSDGFIRPCMSTSEKLFHVDKYEKDFYKMWNSDELVQHRERVNRDGMKSPCRFCYQSSFANWNRQESFLQSSNSFSPTWG